MLHLVFNLIQVANYAQELEDMKHATKQEFIASLRRFMFLIVYLVNVLCCNLHRTSIY